MKENPVKVLHVVTSLSASGVPSLLYSYYTRMNRDLIHFDFVVIPSDVEHSYREKFEAMGSEVHYMPKTYAKRISYLYNLIKRNKYDVVHSHIELASAVYLTIAKFAGIKTRIAHAHMAFLPYDKLYHTLLRWQLNCIATHKMGCSKEALKGLFGKRSARKGLVLHNAIDIERFSFKESIRNEYRNKFHLNGKTILGFVGRLTQQKNIFYMLDIFEEYQKINPQSLLMVIGDGELRDEFITAIKRKGLEDKVLCFGMRDDVSSLMMSMDFLLLPSLWEGLGIVLIEAQTAALMTLTSKTTVPIEDTNISEYIHYLDINQNPSVWAKEICNIKMPYNKREIRCELIKNHYDIDREAIRLCKLYLRR